MTRALYLDDCYLKEFDAKVVNVENGKFVVLDQTCFYPTGGGQLHDEGILVRKFDCREFKVVYVNKSGDEISHEIENLEGAKLKEGDEVFGVLDWKRRYKLMRAHTAAHIYSEIIHRNTNALITGNQLGLDKIRIDFNTEKFDKEKLKGFIEEANKIVKQDLPIKVYYLSREEADRIPGVSKLAKGLSSSISKVRIVEIEGFDIQADGGTHVCRTGEVGKLEFLSAENKGKDNRRIYFRLA
ncbi:alanyl-tRNA editing protein AlaX [Candidatus Woesearchaeota archaeon]|nr:MAG: alanyl-tRNA editing protein AlaX [Candidatus Woesearchaeota archaeon]